MGIKTNKSTEHVWRTCLCLDKNSELLQNGWEKEKRAAGLASTYRNDTGANAELTTG